MKYERILLDIETQRDFFHPSGSLYNERSPGVLANIYRLFDWARQENIPVLSTVLRVRPFERGPLGDLPHCVDETEGESKMPRTILPNRVNLGLLNTTDLPSHLFEQAQQIIIEKRETDIFSHARAERLVTELQNSAIIVCGAGIAHGIVQAVVGLRSRGLDVMVASDAMLDLESEEESMTQMARLRMEAKGAIFAPTAEIVAPAGNHRPAARFRTAAKQAVGARKLSRSG